MLLILCPQITCRKTDISVSKKLTLTFSSDDSDLALLVRRSNIIIPYSPTYLLLTIATVINNQPSKKTFT